MKEAPLMCLPWHDETVPFHLGGHKPIAAPKRAAFSLKLRLQVAAMGAFVVFLGMFRLSHGVLSVINFYAIPIPSGALAATGAILLMSAVIPVGWLEKPPTGCCQIARVGGIFHEVARLPSDPEPDQRWLDG